MLYSFQKLLEEEFALSGDLKNIESKYDDWNQPVDPSLLKPTVRSISKSYISNTDITREVSYKDSSFKCYSLSSLGMFQVIHFNTDDTREASCKALYFKFL